MPYSSVSELPQAVRDRFKNKPKRLRQFMHVWNSEYNSHGDESRAFASAWSAVQKGVQSMADFSFFLPITKVDKERRTVSGYASTPTLDLDGEIVSLDAVRKALPGYWEWRNIREMHTNSAIGVAKEANVDGTGLFLTAKIVDDDAWQKCLEQVYKGFSIGGKKLAKTGNTITDIDLVEISVVDRPANPDCRFEVNKRASGQEAAHLVKIGKTFEEKMFKKIFKRLEALEKAAPKSPTPGWPPAARDGFSRPAKKSKKCAIHGIKNCSLCVGKQAPNKEPSPADMTPINDDPFRRVVGKRDVSSKERRALASRGHALPDGSFPIKNKEDLDNARQAIGRSKNPGAARALIRRRAKELGVELPDNWSKKYAKALIREAEFDRYSLPDGIIEQKSYSLGPDLDLVKRAKPTPPTTDYHDELLAGVADMDPNNLDQVLERLMKRGTVVTKAQHLQISKANIKKARKARMDAEDAIKAAHAMHKAAYLSKAGKNSKPKPDGDDDDFDHTGAMEKLGKAYQSLNAMKTFMKAATNHLKKAASRSGQRGEEVSDPKAPWYTVPPGIHDLSPSNIATAGPGGDNHGSEPPIHSLETEFPGKVAKNGKRGNISQEMADLIARAAAAEAEAKLLKQMPAGPVNGRRPATFDVSKFANDPRDNAATAALLNGVDANGLSSDDENMRKAAVGRLIGNMITTGQGRTVFDPAFHGSAGG